MMTAQSGTAVAGDDPALTPFSGATPPVTFDEEAALLPPAPGDGYAALAIV